MSARPIPDPCSPGSTATRTTYMTPSARGRDPPAPPPRPTRPPPPSAACVSRCTSSARSTPQATTWIPPAPFVSSSPTRSVWPRRPDRLLEQLEHGAPGSAGRGRVVGEPRDAGLVRPWVGEAVLHAAVDVHAPVDAARLHLVLEAGPSIAVDVGVLRADADQHRAGDVAGILRADGRQPGVEPDEGPEVGTAAGQLEHQGAAEAVADGGQPLRVDAGRAPEDVEPRGGDGPSPIGVLAYRRDPLPDAGITDPELPAAVGVEGDSDVAQPRQPVRPLPVHVVQPGRLVGHQHGRQRRAGGGAVRDRQMTDHHDPAVGLVLDLARRHHPPEPTTRPADAQPFCCANRAATCGEQGSCPTRRNRSPSSGAWWPPATRTAAATSPSTGPTSTSAGSTPSAPSSPTSPATCWTWRPAPASWPSSPRSRATTSPAPTCRLRCCPWPSAPPGRAASTCGSPP